MISGKTAGEEPIVVARTMSNTGPVSRESDTRHQEDIDRDGHDRHRSRLADAKLAERQIVALGPRTELHRSARPADGQDDLSPSIDEKSNRGQ